MRLPVFVLAAVLAASSAASAATPAPRPAAPAPAATGPVRINVEQLQPKSKVSPRLIISAVAGVALLGLVVFVTATLSTTADTPDAGTPPTNDTWGELTRETFDELCTTD